MHAVRTMENERPLSGVCQFSQQGCILLFPLADKQTVNPRIQLDSGTGGGLARSLAGFETRAINIYFAGLLPASTSGWHGQRVRTILWTDGCQAIRCPAIG